MEATRKVYRACNLCEAICGLEFEVQGKKILSIKPDKLDPFSKGHICPKGPEVKTIYEDPERLKRPIKRTKDGWKEISYEEAFDEVAKRIYEIQSKYGNDSVAVYEGNPNAHNYGSLLFGGRFINKLKSRSVFVATSVDQLPHHFVSHFMVGHYFLIPVPDVERTHYFLIMGGNPLASKGSMMTVPDIDRKLRDIRARGGKVVVVDPRKTETAEVSDEHVFIHPETDSLFLLGMINVIFSDGKINIRHLAPILEGLDEVKKIAENFSPEKVEKVTGVSADTIRRIAREFVSAPGAVAYGRVGLSTQSFGALAQWLINVINIITGNFDHEGGAMFPNAAVDMVALSGNEGGFGRWKTKVKGLPEFQGELPVAAMADEINYSGEDRIRGLVTIAGNPVLSTPNGRKLENAIRSLEFHVSVDIYINETNGMADIIIPPTTTLEHEHYDLVFHSLAVHNTAKYSPPVFEPEGTLHDWEIFSELIKRLDSHRTGKPVKSSGSKVTPESMLDYLLRSGPYGTSKGGNLNLEELKKHEHGIDLGNLRPCLLDKIQTEDKKLHLAPKIIIKDVERLNRFFQEKEERISSGKKSFYLIGRRHLRNNNSWMHNVPRLMSGKPRCTAMINSSDAKILGLKQGSRVKIKSRVGEVIAESEITDSIMQGVISLPHGFGHNRNGSKTSVVEGVSVNDLTDDERIDELCGNAALSGVEVELEAV